MGKKKDWTGQKYNRLTFVRPTDIKKSGTPRNIIWELLCDCGEITYIVPYEVVSGNTKSCGCYGREVCAAMGKTNGQCGRVYAPIISSARTVWATYKDGCDFETFFSLSQERCHYCNREPYRSFNVWSQGNYSSAIQKEQGNFTYNGLDRIDSNRDHSPDNVVPCCYDCNKMKSDFTYEDFLAHIERMYEHTRRFR